MTLAHVINDYYDKSKQIVGKTFNSFYTNFQMLQVDIHLCTKLHTYIELHTYVRIRSENKVIYIHVITVSLLLTLGFVGKAEGFSRAIKR